MEAGIAGVVLGLSLALIAVGGVGNPDPTARGLDALGVLLALVSALALPVRTRSPLMAYALTAAATVALIAAHYPLDVPLGPMVAVYALGVAYGATRRGQLAGLGAIACMTAAAVVVELSRGTVDTAGAGSGIVAWALLLVSVWIAGDRMRLRRAEITELRERARRAARDAERERRLAAAEERTRIARELHDSAGHAINVILLQAGAARLLDGRDPVGARRSLATVERVAREMIGEIDRLVRALRDDDGAPVGAPSDPAAIEELLERHRSAGLRIAGGMCGRPDGVPRSVAWATYRILQEALTNARRHGDGSADVAVDFRSDAAAITIVNPARMNGHASGGGHGIVGMRERAALLGGTLEAGGAGGSFRVHARLPYLEGRT